MSSNKNSVAMPGVLSKPPSPVSVNTGVLRESPGPARVDIRTIPSFGNDVEFQIPGVLDESLLLSLLPEGYDLPEDVILTGNKCWLNSLLLVFAVNRVQFSRVQADYLIDLIRLSNDVQQNPAVLDIARVLGTTSFEWVLYEVLVSANTCINLTDLTGGPPVYIVNNATADGQIDSHWYVVLPEGSPLVTRFSAVRNPIVRDARGSREARAARSAHVAQGKGGKGAVHVPPIASVPQGKGGKGAVRVPPSAPVAQGKGGKGAVRVPPSAPVAQGKGKKLDEFEEACKASEASYKQAQNYASELLAAELASLDIHNYNQCKADHDFAKKFAMLL